jgi:hypothetical protein
LRELTNRQAPKRNNLQIAHMLGNAGVHISLRHGSGRFVGRITPITPFERVSLVEGYLSSLGIYPVETGLLGQWAERIELYLLWVWHERWCTASRSFSIPSPFFLSTFVTPHQRVHASSTVTLFFSVQSFIRICCFRCLSA